MIGASFLRALQIEVLILRLRFWALLYRRVRALRRWMEGERASR